MVFFTLPYKLESRLHGMLLQRLPGVITQASPFLACHSTARSQEA